MSKSKPCVSIGLPVYNGEKFIEEAINSLLNQTFTDLEIIICDNNSTDATESICQEYALKDKRIRYYRNGSNIGAARNFNRTFKLAKGKYFKWAAHDDICDPTFLERCVEILENKPEVVLCYPRTNIIDQQGKTISYYQLEFKTNSLKAHERFYDITRLHHRNYQIFGLIRTNILEKTPLIASYAGSDRSLVAILTLYGQFFEIPEYLLQARRHQKQSMELLFNPHNKIEKILRMHKYSEWFDPKNQGKILLPNWRILQEYIWGIKKSPLVGVEQFLCFIQLIKWMFSYWNGAKLIRDILIATIQIIHIVYAKNILQPSTQPEGSSQLSAEDV
ncbi:hypothetical protein AFK68_17425 [Hydrocoleum sp. CS-953]|uniref:glycosyltransferase family 2 protein n=1 Tax=Hydrocoleum sp. CS-953 TaxID=1671698 RepID=UPI000B9B84CF|nr:glycosyltransferase family A protein [Hydrocoleum sp. CS-953]OZH53470.1 hypothetical protein AFK68_17425 [Hydrocoleum sp. CS-953]